MANFNKIFYASLLGVTVDMVSFGNDLNYYCWIGMVLIWCMYEFNKYMIQDRKWNYVKNLFESE
jgi:hypothetical protein